MEALQCVKCAIRHDLLFKEPAPSSAVEAEADDEDSKENDVTDKSESVESWDEMLLDEDDDEDDGEMDVD